MTDINNKPGEKILIVEDDEINRKVMELQLRNYYFIVPAKDGEEAIKLFLQNDYDLILMDINLGAGINGMETMEKIREFDKGKTIPIIAITAYASYGNRGSFLAKGFNNYISKPYHYQDLLKCIKDEIKVHQ